MVRVQARLLLRRGKKNPTRPAGSATQELTAGAGAAPSPPPPPHALRTFFRFLDLLSPRDLREKRDVEETASRGRGAWVRSRHGASGDGSPEQLRRNKTEPKRAGEDPGPGHTVPQGGAVLSRVSETLSPRPGPRKQARHLPGVGHPEPFT